MLQARGFWPQIDCAISYNKTQLQTSFGLKEIVLSFIRDSNFADKISGLKRDCWAIHTRNTNCRQNFVWHQRDWLYAILARKTNFILASKRPCAISYMKSFCLKERDRLCHSHKKHKCRFLKIILVSKRNCVQFFTRKTQFADKIFIPTAPAPIIQLILKSNYNLCLWILQICFSWALKSKSNEQAAQHLTTMSAVGSKKGLLYFVCVCGDAIILTQEHKLTIGINSKSVCACLEFHHFNAMPTTTISFTSHKMRIHKWDSSSSSSEKNLKWNSHNAEDHGEKQLWDTIVIDKSRSRMEFIHTYVQWWPRSWCEPIGKHQ